MSFRVRAPRLAVLLRLAAFGLAVLIASLSLAAAASANDGRLRTVLTADPELDDSNSVVRYLLRSTDFKTEGLVYASSGVHWKGDGTTRWWQPGREYDRFGLAGKLCPCTSWRWSPDERFIDDAVDRYAQAYPNLKVHDRRYPNPESLRSKIVEGNVEFDSDISEDTAGSELIKRVLLDDQGGPVYLLAFGGPSTIARALKSIQLQYQETPRWPAIYRKVMKKAKIVAFGAQDYSYRDYISVSWPSVEFREASTSTWGYGARDVVLPENAEYLSAKWTKENVSSVGPFGDFYRVWGDGKQMVKDDIFDHFGFRDLTTEQLKAMGYVVWTPPQEPGSWISEGDTSTFLTLVDNGLRSDENPSWGGWGGRQVRNPEDPSEWVGDLAKDKDASGAEPEDYAASRWFGDAQRDFAARLRWSATPKYADANHPPVAKVRGGVDVRARAGQTVDLRSLSRDPDGDAITTRWWQYREAGTYPGAAPVTGEATPNATVRIPADAKRGSTIHVILAVTDKGEPALTAYQRVVITVA